MFSSVNKEEPPSLVQQGFWEVIKELLLFNVADENFHDRLANAFYLTYTK